MSLLAKYRNPLTRGLAGGWRACKNVHRKARQRLRLYFPAQRKSRQLVRLPNCVCKWGSILYVCAGCSRAAPRTARASVTAWQPPPRQLVYHNVSIEMRWRLERKHVFSCTNTPTDNWRTRFPLCADIFCISAYNKIQKYSADTRRVKCMQTH